MTPVEVRAILGELDRRLSAELARFWHRLAETSTSEFRDLVIAAYPELVTPYVSAAADLGAVWYDSQPSTNTRFSASPAELPPVEKLQSSASWALAVGNGDQAIALLTGSAERALFDGLRDTVLDNVGREPGARWARHASANACSFCRMLATRGADYIRESTADFKSHDACRCMAVPARPGHPLHEAPYVEEWRKQYQRARSEAGSGDPKQILNAWNRLIND